MIFHAGTRKNNETSAIVTDGGRVLSITATGSNLREARNKVYKNISTISFFGCNYRKDIAAREVN
jgi:phosphoribosylamine--glycine ligase